MNLRMRTLAVLVPSLLVALPASAALPIKPGLWETSSKMQTANGEVGAALAAFQQQMANMTPEQRKSLEGLIAKNGGGFTLPTVGADGAVVTKVCLTREMIEKSQLPTQPNQHGCTHKSSPVSGGVMTATFSCTNPPAKGQARFVLASETAYTMTMTSSATINGKTENMKVEGSGKWLGADCGAVKPVSMK
jgi:hypothetical protein